MGGRIWIQRHRKPPPNHPSSARARMSAAFAGAPGVARGVTTMIPGYPPATRVTSWRRQLARQRRKLYRGSPHRGGDDSAHRGMAGT